jgi:SAM-dependent methyltransferase
MEGHVRRDRALRRATFRLTDFAVSARLGKRPAIRPPISLGSRNVRRVGLYDPAVMEPTKTPTERPADRLTRLLFGFMTTQAVATAAKLGIADRLRDGPKTLDELAAASGCDARALGRVLRLLVAHGIFDESDGRYASTDLGELLRAGVPKSLRGFAIYMGADFHWDTWRELETSVRSGLPAFEALHGRAFFQWLPENDEPKAIFHDAMTSFSSASCAPIVAALDVGDAKSVVDVGGGHGYLLSALLRAHPKLHGTLLDAPGVVEGAVARFRAEGIDSRSRAVAGDFFESVPEGGDVYFMKHIVHDWNDEDAARILGNCARAMRPGGRVLTIEMVLPDRPEPALGAFLDLEMLVFLHSFERTAEQYRALYRRAGLEVRRILPTASAYSIVEGVRAGSGAT